MPICLEGIDYEEVTKTEFGHVLDPECLVYWLNSQRNAGLETGSYAVCSHIRQHREAEGWEEWPAGGQRVGRRRRR